MKSTAAVRAIQKTLAALGLAAIFLTAPIAENGQSFLETFALSQGETAPPSWPRPKIESHKPFGMTGGALIAENQDAPFSLEQMDESLEADNERESSPTIRVASGKINEIQFESGWNPEPVGHPIRRHSR